MSKFTNFLATDKVPETLFGFPVVTKDYTEEDLEFFREHPEAAGYYDLGDEGEGDGDAEEQADLRGGKADDAYVRKVNAAVDDAIPFVKEHEGFRGKAYKDQVGVWTVGYGQTEIDGRPVREGDTISEKNASVFLVNRMRENAAAMYRQNPWTRHLSQGALSALYDVAYNLGVGALSERRSPNLNRDLNAATAGHDNIVWRELPTYVNAGGRQSRGLVNRRNDALRRWGPAR
jgi:lysozyme